jgi:Cytochrome oxidase complex assembly protein 1
MTYATNQEKISSSVFRSIMRSVRGDAEVRELLGDAVRPAPEWWLNGDPRIEGRVSLYIRVYAGRCSRCSRRSVNCRGTLMLASESRVQKVRLCARRPRGIHVYVNSSQVPAPCISPVYEKRKEYLSLFVSAFLAQVQDQR